MNPAPVPAISPDEEISFMNVDRTDFAAMSRAQQIRHFEVEGYVVFPSILKPDIIARIQSELAEAEMSHTSYSVNQTRSSRSHSGQPGGLRADRLSADDRLSRIWGPTSSSREDFSAYASGSPGISMHTDGQPHGSNSATRGALPAAGFVLP